MNGQLPTLAAVVDMRIRIAGLQNDPALEVIREHNRRAMAEQLVRVELRRGQFGQTRRLRLDELGRQW